MELLGDYDFTLSYHPGKGNKVADALSRRWEVSTAMLKMTEEMSRWTLDEGHEKVTLAAIEEQEALVDAVLKAQQDSVERAEMLGHVAAGEAGFATDTEGGIRVQGRLWVPLGEVRQKVLGEAHHSTLAIHPGSSKMYQDLKRTFWWPGLKQDVAEHVAKCLTCQQVKIEHQKPGGLLQQIEPPTWKWEHITMDFVTGLPKT